MLNKEVLFGFSKAFKGIPIKAEINNPFGFEVQFGGSAGPSTTAFQPAVSFTESINDIIDLDVSSLDFTWPTCYINSKLEENLVAIPEVITLDGFEECAAYMEYTYYTKIYDYVGNLGISLNISSAQTTSCKITLTNNQRGEDKSIYFSSAGFDLGDIAYYLAYGKSVTQTHQVVLGKTVSMRDRGWPYCKYVLVSSVGITNFKSGVYGMGSFTVESPNAQIHIRLDPPD